MYAQLCFFHSAQHQWTNTWKAQCSHLNLTQILPSKNLSKTGAHSQIHPGANLLNILLWKYDARQNLCKFLMQTGKFQSMLHAKLNTLEKFSTFKGQCWVNVDIFICNLLTGPLIKINFKWSAENAKNKSFRTRFRAT